MTRNSKADNSIETAVAAMQRGFQPVPITDGGKRPYGAAWTHLRWEDAETVRTSFREWAESGAGGVGLLLGEPSGGLIDVDLDHPKALRLRDHLLPPTPMRTGRPGRPHSHRWYLTDTMLMSEDQSEPKLPGTRRHKLADGSVSVEFRSTGSQTVIPPSVHPSGEQYRWEGDPWGGEEGPAFVPARTLATQVALLGLGSVLLDAWPVTGSRHDAYLALAGGLLRFGDGGVHPWWEKNLPVLISALADATNDEDGPEARVSETMGTTIGRLREGGKAVGFPRLAEIVGVDQAEAARRMAREVESLSGYPASGGLPAEPSPAVVSADDEEEGLASTLPPEKRNPMEERVSSWSGVDLEPYLNGEVQLPVPSVLTRVDGEGLMYPGRVNSLFGLSESGKTWVAAFSGVQEMAKGERMVYLDFEDEPSGIITRMTTLGAGHDDLQNQLAYVHPEGPLSDMERTKFGSNVTDEGQRNASAFRDLMSTFDPTLVIVDGLNELYGLHGHDTNDATGTSIITAWLKRMTRGGRTTVVVIDHTGKGGGPGSSPIGAHHKIAMVQGTALRVDIVERPIPGEVGRVNLCVFKDRPGMVRKIAGSKDREPVVSEVVIDSTSPDRTLITLHPANPDNVVIGETPEQEDRLQGLAESERIQEAILRIFGGDVDREVNTAEVLETTGATKKQVYDAWSSLTMRSVLVRVGQNKHTRYRLNPNPPSRQE